MKRGRKAEIHKRKPTAFFQMIRPFQNDNNDAPRYGHTSQVLVQPFLAAAEFQDSSSNSQVPANQKQLSKDSPLLKSLTLFRVLFQDPAYTGPTIKI